MNSEDYINHCYLDESLIECNEYEKEDTFSIYKYFEIIKKTSGDTFGEFALQHEDNKRIATVIASNDCIFGIISKQDYNNCLRNAEIKKSKKESNFILNPSIFGKLDWIIFEKTYFKYFKKEYLKNSQIIINQNETIENLYFIMEGQIEIATNLNYNEIKNSIKQKRNSLRKKNHIFLY